MTTLTFDERGLIPAIVQDRLTGEVRMLAWMNAEALATTLSTRRATFYSRSRARLWTKGETSGHTLEVVDLRADCDGDTLLVLVDPSGPSCHTGRDNCFFEQVLAGEGELGLSEAEVPLPELLELERVIARRAASTSERSYTKSLLEAGAEKIGKKLREEADELARAVDAESAERVASEAADVLYHLMVGLRSRGVDFRAVLAELARRAGVSGHAEKAARAVTPKTEG